MGKIFCSNCGTTLDDKAKFCFKCGSKINLSYSEHEDRVTKNLHVQYRDIICDEVVTSYINDINLGLAQLYQKGESYNFSKAMVDEIVAEQRRKINIFTKYLSTLYINGPLLMLDIDDDEINECIQYAINIELDEDDARCIYDYYVETNLIKEKGDILRAQLDSYKKRGVLSNVDDIKKDYADIDNYDFYIRFVKALSDLEELQSSLHDQSNSMELTENDKNVIAEKAFDFGFSNWDDVYRCIDGAEEKLGFAEKVRLRDFNLKIEKNEKMFSSICPAKEITIFGEKVRFESSFFIPKFITNSVIASTDLMASNLEGIENFINNLDSKSDYSKLVEYCKPIVNLRYNAIKDVTWKLPISKSDKTRMLEHADEKFEGFDDQSKNIFLALATCITALDNDVENVKLENELNKSMRGRWSGGGFGLKGAVKGAVMSSALNAGTGLVYSAFNGISNALAKSNATKKKKEVWAEFLNEIIKYIQELSEEVVLFCVNYINSNYTLVAPLLKIVAVSAMESCGQELRNGTPSSSTLINLIKSNPYDMVTYIAVATVIVTQELSERKADMKSLITIAGWFDIDKKRFRNEITENTLNSLKNKNKEKCFALYKIETAFEDKNDELQKKVYGEYLNSDTSTTLKKYSFDELKDVITNIDDFGQKHEYAVNAYKQKIINDFVTWHIENDLADFSTENLNILTQNINNVKEYYDCPDIITEAEKVIHSKIEANYKIDLNATDPNVIDASLEKIKQIDNQCIYDFSVLIAKLEKKQKTVGDIEYKSKSEADNARKEMQTIDDIMSDSTITLFDKVCRITQCQFNSESAKKQEVTLLKKFEDQIETDIEQNADNPAVIDAYLKTVREINDKNLCDFSILIAELEKKQKMVGDIEYKSKSEADDARKEMRTIDDIMNDNTIITLSEKVYRIMQCRFHSESAIQQKIDLEKKLLNQINIDEANLSRQTTAGKLLLYIILTPIIGIVGCCFHWIGLIIALCVVVGMWSSYRDNFACAKEHNQKIALRRQNINNFNKFFVIKDNKLVSKELIEAQSES